MFCDCGVALVAERFRARERHPGHLDRELGAERVDERVAAWAAHPGPLGLDGGPVVVDTTRPVDGAALAALAGEVGALLAG
ncbi:hypothetical protein ABZY68_04250 [Streptomyces sp. NPDC006482]|uniref:hypothetical protein n=1 Tax=Streptomyces sp. NPDC006482 TaxID=3154306 RepID=UPI0033A4BCAC